VLNNTHQFAGGSIQTIIDIVGIDSHHCLYAISAVVKPRVGSGAF